ncbi:XLF-domain-containing protein [Plenodomus tracheiphilus IPT5]|uniref:Non-homologous end-joining factor 1 n=1 Tax=Plenodomus tracheiphilus IPT5 TaxID=1408161 RepID=A0A6A7AN37_9PLEO|nr:XLF-domain-containing protein [Plenodomus tracheiphilus IPT5]
MSCWRVLPGLEQSDGTPIPQLLVKPDFNLDSYKLHVTDLSNIWAEELQLNDIVGRASIEQSPIEVSKHDTAQLAILLDNIQKALVSSDGPITRVTRSDEEGITLHTSVALPEPLGFLTWKHHLKKRTPATLKNELILPLLVSSHIQHERISGLISTLTDKDKAIDRLLDQYEASNLDLAAAFPSIGSLKAGRRTVRREQAAKHISALQPFREDPWREHTAQVKDSNVTTLGLFQEALVHSTPSVPQELKSTEHCDAWWFAIPDKLSALQTIAKRRKETSRKITQPKKASSETSDDETEDEFGTHDNFKKRAAPDGSGKAAGAEPVTSSLTKDEDGDVSTEDEEDLDAPSQSQSRNQKGTDSAIRITSPSLAPTMEEDSSREKTRQPKSTGFRIGGKGKKVPEKSPSPSEEQSALNANVNVLPSRDSLPPSSQLDSQANTTPRKARRQFKIGGKGKSNDGDPSQHATASPRANRTRTMLSPTAEPPSSPPPQGIVRDEMPVPEIHEETPEEKAVRKRAELKRKNDEAAKKHARQKKKKRF